MCLPLAVRQQNVLGKRRSSTALTAWSLSLIISGVNRQMMIVATHFYHPYGKIWYDHVWNLVMLQFLIAVYFTLAYQIDMHQWQDQ